MALRSAMARACVVLTVSAVSACASSRPAPPKVELPLAVGNGAGSQYGNYAALPDGEFKGTRGERCVAFNWDRPLGNGQALRMRSASCEALDHPGFMTCHEISRTVIPLAGSNLVLDGE